MPEATSPPSAEGATRVALPPAPTQASTGELVGRLSDQVSRLVRDEVRLAQAEVTHKAKRLGIGAGFFGGAGMVLPGWLAAVIASVQTDIDTVKEAVAR